MRANKEAAPPRTQDLRQDIGTVGRHVGREAFIAAVPAYLAHRRNILEEIKGRNPEPEPELPVNKFKRTFARLNRMTKRTVRNEMEVLSRVGESDVLQKLGEGALVGLKRGIEVVLMERKKNKPQKENPPSRGRPQYAFA